MTVKPEERHTPLVPILMHICCAPDATVPVPRLRAKGYEPVGFFYDPNIQPKTEYELRLEQARKLAFID
ncbi:MAG: epoxyqueuosine reductase QueH, partial [Caldiserica bacterium]|nr:epoxyqueuosine reductase QueH [Caldisericota bacterium]